MVTDLPAEVPQLEGIAAVCETGQLLAHAGDGDGDVLAEAVVQRGGERLRPLARSHGPVTIRVYLPESGKPAVRVAEYHVEGGRSFTVRFNDLGKAVTVKPPENQPVVSSRDVMTVLAEDGAY
jgi:hypothetical protein